MNAVAAIPSILHSAPRLVEAPPAPIAKKPLYTRESHKDDSIIRIGNVCIGAGHFAVIAGPCSVESFDQLVTTAFAVRDAGGTVLRGGAFKPRTSP